ncbi:hypothetical protein HMPREF2533_01724 [Bacteroides fragilis]|nr:hypothetical protein HMPREF2530_01724 [Bacteroides fragilis]KXU47234.1 hypothetical protein HMPREF2533_01724 [Bacteroides fragilis]
MLHTVNVRKNIRNAVCFYILFSSNFVIGPLSLSLEHRGCRIFEM